MVKKARQSGKILELKSKNLLTDIISELSNYVYEWYRFLK